MIETEWTRSLERQRPDLVGKLDVRRDSMREAVPDWEVHESAWRALVAGLELPDPDDRHVLAAAIAGHADCIVTSNLKDFPAAVLLEYVIEAVDPDTFIINQWDLNPVSAIAAFKRMRSRRRKPQSSPDDFAYALEVGGLPTTAERLSLTGPNPYRYVSIIKPEGCADFMAAAEMAGNAKHRGKLAKSQLGGSSLPRWHVAVIWRSCRQNWRSSANCATQNLKLRQLLSNARSLATIASN